MGDLVTVASNEDLTFVTLTAQLHGAGGNHTVYLVCAGQGRVGTLDWIRFEGGAGPTATPAPMAVNLAYGHRVEASSVALDGAGSCCQTDFATDGDSDTRWGSQYTDPQWIMVDLGQVETIDRIVLKWEVAFGKDYYNRSGRCFGRPVEGDWSGERRRWRHGRGQGFGRAWPFRAGQRNPTGNSLRLFLMGVRGVWADPGPQQLTRSHSHNSVRRSHGPTSPSRLGVREQARCR